RRTSRQPSVSPGCRSYWYSWAQHLHGDDEILGLAETTGRQALVLLVGQRHPPSQRLVDVLCHVIITDREVELLRIGARHRHHRQLAFPRLTEPSLLRKLLHESGPFAFGVAPLESGPGVQHEGEDWRQQYTRDDQFSFEGELKVEFHGRQSTSY